MYKAMSLSTIAAAICFAYVGHCHAAVAPEPTSGALQSAPILGKPASAPVISATNAGKRTVAVGDYGVIILSDDGVSFRQAKAVPTRALLTHVVFLDDKRGWACGHDGTVLATSDGGDTWKVLRQESGKDRVLLSIWFENAQHGIAVGQFGLAIETLDGGATWQERKLVDGEAGERHLMQIFSGGSGLVLVAAEAGTLLRSEDGGKSWKTIQTANKGSFWTGHALKDGSILVSGMRGHVYRSSDRGMTWHAVNSGTQQSITSIVQRSDGDVVLYGNGGVVLSSKDHGQSFKVDVRADRANITASVSGQKTDLSFALSGVLPASTAK